MKVFCLYNDGNHIACFETEQEAIDESVYFRMGEISEEDFEPNCDCKNVNLPEKFK